MSAEELAAKNVELANTTDSAVDALNLFIAALQAGATFVGLDANGNMLFSKDGKQGTAEELGITLPKSQKSRYGQQENFNQSLEAAQAAGFSTLAEQDDYIAAMVANGDNDNFSDGGMLSIDEIIAENAEAWKTLTDEEKAEKALEIQRKYANQLARMEEGLAELATNGQAWLKVLKSENKSLKEQTKIMGDLRKSYAKILGLTDSQMAEMPEDFFLNPDNLELATTAAENAGEKGQEALDKLQVAAAKAIDPFDNLDTKMDDIITRLSQLDLNAGDILTGQDAADAEAYWDGIVDKAMAGKQSLVSAVQEANASLNSLGIDVEPGFEIVTENMSAGQFAQLYEDLGSNSFEVDLGNGKTTTITVDNYQQVYESIGEGTIPVTYVKGKNGKGLKHSDVTGGSPTFTKTAEKPGGQRRGGGGGGSRRRYLAKVKPEDHKERYHEINNALDEVTDALERLNKQQDRAWGAERLKSMQAESAELKKQRDLIRDKIDEAQDYLEQDLAEAALHGWTFDENNNVSNYEENWDRLLAVYNGKIEEYNNMSIAEQEAIDKKFEETNDKYYEAKAKGDTAAMDQYDDYINPDTGIAFGSYEEYLKYHYLDEPTAALEQVEETMDELEQLGIDYDDVLNSLYDNFIEQVQTKWDTANEIADANIEYLEHKISRLEDNAYKAAETIGLMSDKMDHTQDKFNAATTALDDLLKGYDSAWSAEAIMAGQVTAEDLAGAGMDANAVEMVQSIMSELMNLEQEMTDTLIESFESMTEAFDEFNEDLDRYISTIEHAQSITSTYRNIIDLTGKSMSGFSTELLKAFNSATIDQAKANMKSNKTKYDTVQAEYDEAYQQYLNAQTLHAQGKLNDAALKAAKEAFEATQDNLNEAQEAYVASWEAALQAVADAYTSTMEGVMDEISKNLTNGLAGGLDALQERMDRMKTKDSNYVDDYEKIYQLTKLTRDLETQIDKTSNVRAQKELLKFQKEINGILQSDKKLSEYDIDYLQKKYDLKLAEIALEDAQNAKSQVTMRRDSEGNYNYVYTADENAVAEAEAEYATKLYEMQKANDEYITSLSDSIVSLKVEMRDALLALDPSQFASEEEFNAAVEEIIAFYTEQMSYHQEQLETVLGNNKDLYEQDMVWYNKYANYKMADAASFIDSWNETLLAQATGFETMDELFETFFSQAAVAQSESVTAYRNYVDAINAINAEAGHPTETLAQSLTEDIEAMTDQAEQAATDMAEHAETIVGEITSIGQAIEEMANKFGVEIVNMAKQTDLLVAALTDMLEIMGRAGDIELEEGLLADIEARRQAREQEYASQSFDTGGYTGAWGPEGKLAWLHQKELVLNAADTENILASVGILRQIANTIDLNALTSAGGFISLMSSGISGNRETLQQEVHIEASFPAVTDKNQIEDAFTDLVNLAAQYANRK